jgi:dihydroneopterin aldolase
VKTGPEHGGDLIRIERLEVFAHIGVPDTERAAAQKLTLNITVWPIRPHSDLNDQIESAVNYAAVCAATRQFVAERRDKLIETLADALGKYLLERFEIRRLRIELRKYILPEVEFVSVVVTRDRREE